MDRQRARTCPGGSDPGGTGPAPRSRGRRSRTRVPARTRAPVLLLPIIAALVLTATVLGAGPTDAAPVGPASASALAAAAPPLVLLSQTPWVTPGRQFDLHLRAATSAGPVDGLGLTVSVYSCLSSLSGFDQSLTGSPPGTPVSSTSAPIPLSGLGTVAGGGVDLPLPVVVGGQPSSAAGAPFTIHLLPESGQCQSFPAGVYPVRIQLVEIAGGAVVGSFVTHLVYTEAPADTQRLRVSVVLPVQATQYAAHDPSPAVLLARPSAALAPPPEHTVDAVAATVAAVAVQHPGVPLTLQVSGQTVAMLEGAGRQTALAQLGQLATTPSVHQLTAAPYTPVDAAALVDSGLGAELALQVARGTEVVATATGHPAPAAPAGLGPWITDDGLDATTIGALVGYGFDQVVLPASQLSGAPADGSTTAPVVVGGPRGTQVTAMAASDDLTARFTSDPGNPVLAAHQLAAELAQLYYERPNGDTPRAVAAVAPTTWTDNPAFVDALLGSLDGNPVVQPVTTTQLFSLFPSTAACRSGCRLVASGGGTVPVGAVRLQRTRVNGFADAAVGEHALARQLGDLVLDGQAQALHPAQQSDVLANAGAAVDAQLGQVAVEGDLTVTLTARSGLVPVTVVSTAPYPVATSLVLSSDKLLFPNGESEWAKAVTVLPRHSNVVYVRVRARASGVFRLDVVLRSPDGTLRLAAGSLSIRSTSSSVVGVVLTVGAVVVLVVWWIRTSRRRRARQRADEAADTGGPDGSGPGPEAEPAPEPVGTP